MKTNNGRKALNDELLREYWNAAQPIISEFNEYGGGPEDEEDECPDDAVIFEPYDPLHPQYDTDWESYRSRFDNLGE